MEQRRLGRLGEVSALGLGVRVGEPSGAKALAALRAYLTAGGRHLDTTCDAASEALVGQLWSEFDRSAVSLATAIRGRTGDEVRRGVEASLERLRTDSLELAYAPDPPADPAALEALLALFFELREEGLSRAVGVSLAGPVTDETLALARRCLASGAIDVLQLPYSLLRQRTGELFAEIVEAGVGLVVDSSLESGLLTGRYGPRDVFPAADHRARYRPAALRAMTLAAAEIKATAVRPPYASPAEVALRFALAPEAVGSVVVGARSPEQVAANLAALERPPLGEHVTWHLRRTFGERTAEFNPF